MRSGVSESETSVATRSPDRERSPAGRARGDLEDPPEEHPARAGDRVVLLSALRDRLVDRAAMRAQVRLVTASAAGLFHLAEARRVDVERLDGEEHLPLEEPREVVVEALGRLREGPPGLERPVRAERRPSRVAGEVMARFAGRRRRSDRPHDVRDLDLTALLRSR